MNLMTRGSGTGDSDEWHHRHLMQRSEPPNLDRQRLWTTGSRLNRRKREERIERLWRFQPPEARPTKGPSPKKTFFSPNTVLNSTIPLPPLHIRPPPPLTQ